MTQLRRWDPSRDRLSLRDAIDQLLEESVVRPQARAPVSGALAVDVYETDAAVVVKAAIPGSNPEDVEISITGDTLTIKGELKKEKEFEEADCVCRERFYGTFSRSLTIPVMVESSEAEAEIEDGILTLTLPKAEQVRPKSIEVKSR